MMQIADLINDAVTVEGTWHDNIRDVVAKLIAKGTPVSAILTMADHLTLSGYTVDDTRDQLQVFIDGAVKKGWGPPIGEQSELAGAYTGEISAPMLAGLATWVILGHSERRRDAGETDALIGKKLGRAVDAGLRPILCVGEQLADREAGRAAAVVAGQLAGALAGHDPAALARGRPRDRLRARLGHRDRPQRLGRRRRRRWPTRSAATLRDAGWGDAPRTRSRSSTAAAPRAPTSASSWPSRASTAPSSAAPRSSRTRWPGWSAGPPSPPPPAAPRRLSLTRAALAGAHRRLRRSRPMPHPRPPPPRREHLEQGEPLHRLDRRRPLGDRRRRGPRGRPPPARGGLRLRRRLHLRPQAGDPDAVDRARRDRPDVAARS